MTTTTTSAEMTINNNFFPAILRRRYENNVLEEVTKRKPTKPSENSKKCLFGVPDMDGVENLIQEQIEEDRLRILHRFGFNIIDIETMEHRKLSATSSAKKRKRGSEMREGVEKRRKRLAFDNVKAAATTSDVQDKENIQQ